MELSRSTTLIVGSDGMIGRALMSFLLQSGNSVIGTTRRREILDKDHIFLDLSENLEDWISPKSVSVAVICAGITKLEECKHNPARTAHVNVQGVTTLVKNLIESDIFVIYLSTNHVFDGSSPFRLPEDPLSPITEYGKQKVKTEQQISQYKNPLSIIRLTKVLGPLDSLFRGWRKALQNNQVIHPFSDMSMAPVPLSCAVKVLSHVADRHLSGILQVSGNKDISYSEIAYIGSQLLDVNETFVQPIFSSVSDNYSENTLKHTTLDIQRLRSELRIEPPDVEWTIKKAFTNPESLGIF